MYESWIKKTFAPWGVTIFDLYMIKFIHERTRVKLDCCHRCNISIVCDPNMTQILIFERELALLVALQGESIWKGGGGLDTQSKDASKTLVKHEKHPRPWGDIPSQVSHPGVLVPWTGNTQTEGTKTVCTQSGEYPDQGDTYWGYQEWVVFIS